jgi:phosphopantetheine adenylyltransferase
LNLGYHSEEQVLQRLNRAIDRYNGQLEVARAERHQRTLIRELRQQQDAAYEASLRADRERASIYRKTIYLYIINEKIGTTCKGKRRTRSKRTFIS